MGMLAHGGAACGSSASASWPPSPPPWSCAGMIGDLDYGGGDDLFAISRQMGYANGGGSGSASSAAVAPHEQQQQLYYSSCQPGERAKSHAMHACFMLWIHGSILDAWFSSSLIPWSSWALLHFQVEGMKSFHS